MGKIIHIIQISFYINKKQAKNLANSLKVSNFAADL